MAFPPPRVLLACACVVQLTSRVNDDGLGLKNNACLGHLGQNRSFPTDRYFRMSVSEFLEFSDVFLDCGPNIEV